MTRKISSIALFVSFAACGVTGAASAQTEWHATFLQHPKKAESRVSLNGDPAQLEDRHWLTVQFSEYAGFRPSLAVLADAESKQQELPEATTEVGKIMREMRMFLPADDVGADERFAADRMNPVVKPIVRAALGATHRFRIVDRDVALQAAMGEQDAGAGGRVSKRSAVRIGNIRGASYGVRAMVIETNPEKDVKSIKLGAGVLGTAGAALGGIAVGGKVAFCRINVQVVDMETADVLFDVIVDGTASEKTMDWGGAVGGLVGRRLPLIGGVGAKSSDKREAVLTDAIKVCAAKAAHYVATQLEDRPFQTSVARADGRSVWVIGGEDLGLRSGMQLELLSRGEVLVDPASGDTVDVETRSIGHVRVVDVKEKSARCEASEGSEGAKAGDFVRYRSKKQM